jgi:hypothetical protein
MLTADLSGKGLVSQYREISPFKTPQHLSAWPNMQSAVGLAGNYRAY